jgi:hypothetical protein
MISSRVLLFSPVGPAKIDGIRLARFRALGGAPRCGRCACPGMRRSFDFGGSFDFEWRIRVVVGVYPTGSLEDVSRPPRGALGSATAGSRQAGEAGTGLFLRNGLWKKF